MADVDGDFSDWLELTNHSDNAVNLNGWGLTDDPTLSERDSVIDLDDRDAWLSDASLGREVTLLSGDTDLDGDVDAADLNNLALHWQMSGEHGWQAGDFDGSSSVDSSDLNVVGLRWQHGVVAMQAVPESTGTIWLIVWSAVMFVGLRKYI